MTPTGLEVPDRVDFAPSVDRARAASAEIKAQLAASLLEIADACRDIVPFDERGFERTITAIRAADRVTPLTYASYYDILSALAREDHDEASASIALLSASNVEAGPLVYRNLTPADLGEANVERYVRWLDLDDEQPLDLIPFDDATYARASALCDEAFRLLERAAPEVAAEIRELLTCILFARSREGSKLVFHGASSFFLWGALLINAEQHQTVLRMVEVLAHESAHSLLFGIALNGPLVLNPDEERYLSPVRPDPRPMDGIYHATYVSARMFYALERLVEGGVLDDDGRDEAMRLMRESATAFREGLEVVERHGRLTGLGRELLDSAIEYMARSAA